MCSGKRSYQTPLASAAATSFSTIGRRAASNACSASWPSVCSASALLRAIASSIAKRVPEPIEKCAVRSASPISTRLCTDQRSLRTFGKLRQIDLFDSSRAPASGSANTRCKYSIVSPSPLLAQEPQEMQPPDRRETDAVDDHRRAAMHDREVGPRLHLRRNELVGRRIVGAQELQRLVGKDDAEAESRIGRVLLEHAHAPLG